MNRGFTKAYRKELNGDIWKMPPIYHRVFYYLRQKAEYESSVFPTRKGFGIHVNPGQLITSYQIIADGVSWYEYGVKRTPNKKTIKDVLRWLEGNSTVTVFSNGTGTLVLINNWDTYNPPKEKKVTQNKRGLVTQEKRQLDTPKEVKEVKELKKGNKKQSVFEYPEWLNQKLWSDFKDHRKGFKPKMTEHAETLAINTLKKLMDEGYDQISLIEQTIERGWKSFFPIGNGGGPKTQKKPLMQQNIQAAMDAERRLFGDGTK